MMAVCTKDRSATVSEAAVHSAKGVAAAGRRDSALLSSISLGGVPTVLPDVRDFVVEDHGWMTDQDFTNFLPWRRRFPGRI
jgi:hypothetical protein